MRWCVRVHRFPNGGYAIITDEERWAPVEAGADHVGYVERADPWNADWDEVYVVMPRDSRGQLYYFVRTSPPNRTIASPRSARQPVAPEITSRAHLPPDERERARRQETGEAGGSG